MVHSAIAASVASPMATRTLTGVARPRAPIAHPLYAPNPYDVISPEPVETDKMAKWREGPAQPFEKARSAEGKSLDFPSGVIVNPFSSSAFDQ